MKKLAIIGSGDLGQQIAYHATGYEVVGFFDDFAKTGEVRSFPILGKVINVIDSYKSGMYDELMIGIGYNHMDVRVKLFEELTNEIPFATIIHPSAIIDPSCKIGKGSFIYPGCILDMNVVIGENVSLNVGSTIAHDTHVGSHSMLSPGVVLSGFVKIAPSTQLGTGTKVIDNIKIETGVRTGAGAVVINDLATKGLYVGIPAKFKKQL